jgi:hypothetical protein
LPEVVGREGHLELFELTVCEVDFYKRQFIADCGDAEGIISGFERLDVKPALSVGNGVEGCAFQGYGDARKGFAAPPVAHDTPDLNLGRFYALGFAYTEE